MLGLDTSYLHTKNGWTATGPLLLEAAEGTPAHGPMALAVTAEDSDETLNHDYRQSTQFLKMKQNKLQKNYQHSINSMTAVEVGHSSLEKTLG